MQSHVSLSVGDRGGFDTNRRGEYNVTTEA